MKITNGGNTNENITVDSTAVVIPVGASWEISGTVGVRGANYSDGASNVVEVVIGPSATSIILQPSGESYMESAFLGGASIGLMLLVLVVIHRGLQAGIETG